MGATLLLGCRCGSKHDSMCRQPSGIFQVAESYTQQIQMATIQRHPLPDPSAPRGFDSKFFKASKICGPYISTFRSPNPETLRSSASVLGCTLHSSSSVVSCITMNAGTLSSSHAPTLARKFREVHHTARLTRKRSLGLEVFQGFQNLRLQYRSIRNLRSSTRWERGKFACCMHLKPSRAGAL